ncbi:hypothetical protein FRC08_004637 [Ceratobasidium sp. 394]|nr:hypothetical protein FRC08_004637 [Ceratobasidium sp. 394]
MAEGIAALTKMCHADTKLKPQSTDTSTIDYVPFSEVEMGKMTQPAWAIKEAYKQEHGHQSKGRPEGLQTPEVHTVNGTERNNVNCCSFLYSLYGHPEIQKASAEAESLAKHEVQSYTCVKQEASDSGEDLARPRSLPPIQTSFRYCTLPQSTTTAVPFQPTVPTAPHIIELSKTGAIQSWEILSIGHGQQLAMIGFDILESPCRIHNHRRLFDNGTPERPACVFLSLCPIWRFSRFLSLPWRERFWPCFTFDTVFSGGPHQHHRTHFSNVYQAGSASGSTGFDWGNSGVSDVGFPSGAQSSPSNGFQDTPLSNSLALDGEHLLFHQLARKLGYRVTYEGVNALLVEPPPFSPPSSDQLLPPLAHQSPPLMPQVQPNHLTTWPAQLQSDPRHSNLSTLNTPFFGAPGTENWAVSSLTNHCYTPMGPTGPAYSNTYSSHTPAASRGTVPPTIMNRSDVSPLLVETTAERGVDIPLGAASNNQLVSPVTGVTPAEFSPSTPTCNICSRSFSRQYELEDHAYYHTGIKRHRCPDCFAHFITRSNMTRHRKTPKCRSARSAPNSQGSSEYA